MQCPAARRVDPPRHRSRQHRGDKECQRRRETGRSGQPSDVLASSVRDADEDRGEARQAAEIAASQESETRLDTCCYVFLSMELDPSRLQPGKCRKMAHDLLGTAGLLKHFELSRCPTLAPG